jgi:hypothetical protein
MTVHLISGSWISFAMHLAWISNNYFTIIIDVVIRTRSWLSMRILILTPFLLYFRFVKDSIDWTIIDLFSSS